MALKIVMTLARQWYLFTSAVLFFLFSVFVFFQFNAIRFSAMWSVLGPAVIFFYLTYVSDIFLNFYFLKNAHLNRNVRNVIVTLLRGCVFFVLLFTVV